MSEQDKTIQRSVHVRMERPDFERVKRVAKSVGMKPGPWVRMAALERAGKEEQR